MSCKPNSYIIVLYVIIQRAKKFYSAFQLISNKPKQNQIKLNYFYYQGAYEDIFKVITYRHLKNKCCIRLNSQTGRSEKRIWIPLTRISALEIKK